MDVGESSTEAPLQPTPADIKSTRQSWRTRDKSTPATTAPPTVLTVGDGDFSYSLALSRAFGDAIRLTATTLLDADELAATYERAADNIAELRARSVCIVHGVDATALDRHGFAPQDHVLFIHPHLGLADLQDVEAHSRRHQVLIAHFLASAATCVHIW